jgi:hypothetical protein
MIVRPAGLVELRYTEILHFTESLAEIRDENGDLAACLVEAVPWILVSGWIDREREKPVGIRQGGATGELCDFPGSAEAARPLFARESDDEILVVVNIVREKGLRIETDRKVVESWEGAEKKVGAELLTRGLGVGRLSVGGHWHGLLLARKPSTELAGFFCLGSFG